MGISTRPLLLPILTPNNAQAISIYLQLVMPSTRFSLEGNISALSVRGLLSAPRPVSIVSLAWW